MDSSITVILCVALRLLLLTLRASGILYLSLCPLSVIIYCVVFKNVAVNVVAVDVHWFSDVYILRTHIIYSAVYVGVKVI